MLCWLGPPGNASQPPNRCVTNTVASHPGHALVAVHSTVCPPPPSLTDTTTISTTTRPLNNYFDCMYLASVVRKVNDFYTSSLPTQMPVCAVCVVLQVGLIGEPVDLTYTYTHLGSEGSAISQLAPGQPFFEALKKATHPVVVVGPGVLNRYLFGGGGG